jgi:hypothetical protein
VADEPAADRPLVASYEALREAVLAGRPEGWRYGHGVLAGRGVAAWMAAWSACVPLSAGTTAHAPATAPRPSPAATPSLSSLRNADQIIAVIAQMALAHT